jgi:hypothetical protein
LRWQQSISTETQTRSDGELNARRFYWNPGNAGGKPTFRHQKTRPGFPTIVQRTVMAKASGGSRSACPALTAS